MILCTFVLYATDITLFILKLVMLIRLFFVRLGGFPAVPKRLASKFTCQLPIDEIVDSSFAFSTLKRGAILCKHNERGSYNVSSHRIAVQSSQRDLISL